MILEEIVAWKKQELEKRKKEQPLAVLEREITGLPPCRPLAGVLRRPGKVALIAEIKGRSPSRGVIRENFSPAEIARAYTESGAAAVSVLTEEKFFGGQPDFLPVVRKVTDLPLLRKDFLIDPYQLFESRCIGSDAVLLIAAVLTDRQLKDFGRLAEELGLSAVVEVHTRAELYRALDCDAGIIGINNRDLRTFRTDLRITFNLRPLIKDPEVLVISESGIENRAQVAALRKCGVNGVLVGEALMRSADIREKVRELVGEPLVGGPGN
ncbi:MAG: indole-3-glycerol phosphate synthase TrpC [Desulfotomaculales bacterium]